MPPSFAGSSIVLFYRTGGGEVGNTVIKGVASGNVKGYIGSSELSFSVNNENTSGGFGGVDKETLDHIRYLAPGWFKTTERAITKNDFLVLALKYVSPTYGQVGKAAIIRPQNDADSLNQDIPLQVTIKNLGYDNNGVLHYGIGDISGGVPVVGTYDFLLNLYYPSYMANVMLVYLWCPIGVDVNGDGINETTKYLPPSAAGKVAILQEVKTYLNQGNFQNGEFQGDVGMSVVQTEVLNGSSYLLSINITDLIIDEKYDKVSVMNNVRKALYDLFAKFVPGLGFRKYLLYTAIGNTPGVVSFTLAVNNTGNLTPLPDDKSILPYELLTIDTINIVLYTD
jgi:hypothetical protein